MIPLAVLVGATLVARAVGSLAWSALDDWSVAVRIGLATMLALTASAHFGSRRADLIRMVPPALPRPDLLVTVTGLAELAPSPLACSFRLPLRPLPSCWWPCWSSCSLPTCMRRAQASASAGVLRRLSCPAPSCRWPSRSRPSRPLSGEEGS